VIAIVVVIVAARMWFATSPAPDVATSVSTPTPESDPAPAPTPTPAPAPAPPPEPVATATPEPPRTSTRSPLPAIRSALLCRSLDRSGEWKCDEAGSTVSPGTLYFYTRLVSTAETTVEHRWYHDERLHQRVELRIRANESGFRTYSRMTINAERAGRWKVELRTADGRVLHEKDFSVR
jgi:hypothetical protein